MSNEQYLIASYFAVAAGALASGVLTAVVMRGPLVKAVRCVARPFSKLLGRGLVVWCILAAMLGFLSVSYMDCNHDSYDSVVADRPHIEQVTHSLASSSLNYLTLGVFVYTLGLSVMLVLPRPRPVEPQNAPENTNS